MQSVESLDAQDTETQWNQSDGLEKNESEDWDGDLLQFRFAGLADAGGFVELDLEVELIFLEVSARNGDLSVGNGQRE